MRFSLFERRVAAEQHPDGGHHGNLSGNEKCPQTLRFTLPPPNEPASFVIEIGTPEVQGLLLSGESVPAVDIDSPFSSVLIASYRRNHPTFGVGYYCHDAQRHHPPCEQSSHQGIAKTRMIFGRFAGLPTMNSIAYVSPASASVKGFRSPFSRRILRPGNDHQPNRA